jgi:hypothetical protein
MIELLTRPRTLSPAPESPAPIHLAERAWNALRDGDTHQAEGLFSACLNSSPNDLSALWGLITLRRQHDAAGALLLLDRLIGLQPNVARLYTTRGMLRQGARREVDALEDFASAVCLQPQDAHALYNLGLCYSELFCPAQAEDIALQLLQQQPDWPAARYLLVRAQVGLERDPHTIDREFSALIKQDPLNVELRFARGLLHLKMGDFAQGWDAQEWRWAIEPVKSSVRDFGRPRWSGDALRGRRLLVVAEQGFGDILQFARFLPAAVASGASWVGLHLEDGRAGLKRLLARIKGVDIVGDELDPSQYDVYCPLASLPYVLDTTEQTIPSPQFAELDASDVDTWRHQLAGLPRPWIGLCWAGSSEHFHDVRRSVPLIRDCRFFTDRQAREQRIEAASVRVAQTLGRDSLLAAAHLDGKSAAATMEPLIRRTNGTLVSLQVGPRTADLDELPQALRQRIVTPLGVGADFYDTACLASLLDDVLTVDTSVAHLTGVAAQRGLVIKPAAPEWRWVERDGRPLWYPHLRLMDQHSLVTAA